MMQHQFEVGDRVEWDARSPGAKSTITIRATVVSVVQPGGRVPGLYLPNLGSAGHGMRHDVSYIVRSERGRIYWPVTCMLRAVEEEPE